MRKKRQSTKTDPRKGVSILITVQVCMGSSCFIRGSSQVVEGLKKLIEEHGLIRDVALKGSFCMEHCTRGVTVRIGDQVFTGVQPEDTIRLFRDEILSRARG